MKKKWISFVLLISATTLMCKALETELKKVTENELKYAAHHQDSVHLQNYGVKPISEKMYVKTYKNYKIGPVLYKLEDLQHDHHTHKAHFVCQNLIRFILTATLEMQKVFLADHKQGKSNTKIWDSFIRSAIKLDDKPLFMLLMMDPDFTNASGQSTSVILKNYGYTSAIRDELMLKHKKQSKTAKK